MLNVKTTTVKDIELSLTRSCIIELIRYRELREGVIYTPPRTANVTVPIPGGGDWSNTNLDIDDDEITVKVRWSEVSKE